MKSNELLLKYDSLIKGVAHKFYGVPFEDLYQVGFIGLIKASHNYHNNSGCDFKTYAYKYIFGEMYYLVLQNGFKVNKKLVQLRKLIEKTKDELTQNLGMEISSKVIVEKLGIGEDEYLDAININNGLSLDYEQDNGNLYDYLTSDNIDKEKLIMLKEGLEKLDDKSKNIIIKRYFYDYSQQEIAAMYGMSQTSVSRCEKRLINELNKYVA